MSRHFNLPNHSMQHMTVCGLSLHQGNTESRKTLEQKFIFQIGTLNPDGVNEHFSRRESRGRFMMVNRSEEKVSRVHMNVVPRSTGMGTQIAPSETQGRLVGATGNKSGKEMKRRRLTCKPATLHFLARFISSRPK